MNQLMKYFFRGLLLVVPLGVTVYVVVAFVRWVDAAVYATVEGLLGVRWTVPGVGLLGVVVAVTLLGWLGSTLLARWLFDALDRLLHRLPLVKIIYTSLRDLLSAFVGERKKFDRPVVVQLSDQVRRVGFVTRDDLTSWGAAGTGGRIRAPRLQLFGQRAAGGTRVRAAAAAAGGRSHEICRVGRRNRRRPHHPVRLRPHPPTRSRNCGGRRWWLACS